MEASTPTTDRRLAFRVLAKSPGFAAAARIALALGTGVNTAFFILVNAVFLHPPSYPGARRLVEMAGIAALNPFRKSRNQIALSPRTP
jgi:hypothetical protein